MTWTRKPSVDEAVATSSEHLESCRAAFQPLFLIRIHHLHARESRAEWVSSWKIRKRNVNIANDHRGASRIKWNQMCEVSKGRKCNSTEKIDRDKVTLGWS